MRNFFGLGNINKKGKNEFSYVVKIKTIQNQENRCAKCQEPFGESRMPEFYHINMNIQDFNEKNCQALHLNCYEAIMKSDNSKPTNSIKKEYPELPSDTDNQFYNLDYKDLI